MEVERYLPIVKLFIKGVFLYLWIEDRYLPVSQVVYHHAECFPISVYKDSTVMHGQFVSPTEHGSKCGIWHHAESRFRGCDLMCAADIQVNNVILRLVNSIHSLFVAFPVLLVSFQFLHLLLLLFDELYPFLAESQSLFLHWGSLMLDQVLEVYHKFLNEVIWGSTLPCLKVVNDMLLRYPIIFLIQLLFLL